jgi:serine/threonine protein kinase/tetratricopeptide (TPR) repeat protein/DNA-binding beta-propeller fold protein YncE
LKEILSNSPILWGDLPRDSALFYGDMKESTMAEPARDEKAIFLAALEKTTPAERNAFVEGACAGDPELLERVRELLESHDESVGPLDSPPPGLAATLDKPIAEGPGTVIGPYKLLQKIGEGGFGVVYMADQTEPVKRRVALKIIKPGMDTRQVIARFEAERQALAMMDHPNIAKVLDAGTTDSGRPYFVMELVKGVPITQFCDEHHLTPRERLELFVPVCQAVQHAHQKGVIHRDLKPSNVLVALYDSRAVPKVIDFGVAKATSQTLTEKTMFTQLGQIVGTLEYMSPEQAQRNQLDIDTRSDIYSLGVLLYELLTGETPFDRERLRSAAFDELLRIIREEEPPRPSLKLSSSQSLASIAANRHIEPKRLSTLVRGELDWIVMKALEKDRTRRYETANGFANDIQRYLNDEAVVACPPSVGYRFRKFARRNKAPLATAAVVAVALILGIVGTTWQAIRATDARDDAVQAQMEEAKQRVLAENAKTAAEEARTVAEDARRQEQAQREEAEQQRGWAEAMLVLAIQDFSPVGAAFGPDGNFYVCSWGSGRVLRFHGSTGALIGEFVTVGSGGLGRPQGLVFGPDANSDGTDDLYVTDNDSVLQYDGATGEFLGTFVSVGSGGLRLPVGLTFGPDGNLYVVSHCTDSILRYDAKDGRFLDEFVPARSGGLDGPLMGVFGPDGNLYVASHFTHSILRYDGTSGDFMDAFISSGSGGLFRPEALAFGPEGTLYVTCAAETGEISCLRRYDGNSGQFLDEFIRRGAGGLTSARALVFGPDGNLYVTSCWTDTVPRYDGETGRFIDMFVTYDREALIGPINRSPAARSELIRCYVQMAVAQRQMGNEKAAERIVGRALELAAGSADEVAKVSFGCAVIYSARRQCDKALPYLDQAIRLDPAFSRAYETRGVAHFELADLDKAIEDYGQVIKLKPDDSYAYERRAWAPNMLGDFEGTVEINPKLFAYRQLADAHKGLKQWDKALADYNEAMRVNPEDPNLYVDRGNVHQLLKDWDKASQDYRRALEIEPDYRGCWLRLVDTEFARGASAERTQTVVAEAEAASDGSVVNFQHAAWNLLMNRRGEYERVCREAAARCSDSTDAQRLDLTARAAVLTNEPCIETKQLVDMATRAVEVDPTAWRQHTLGLCLLRDGQTDAAIEWFNRSLAQSWPGAPVNWLGLAIAHSVGGRDSQAQDWLKKAQEWFEQHPLDPTSELPPPDRIECELLLREAEQLLGSSEQEKHDIKSEKEAPVASAEPKEDNAAAEKNE